MSASTQRMYVHRQQARIDSISLLCGVIIQNVRARLNKIINYFKLLPVYAMLRAPSPRRVFLCYTAASSSQAHTRDIHFYINLNERNNYIKHAATSAYTILQLYGECSQNIYMKRTKKKKKNCSTWMYNFWINFYRNARAEK